MVASEVHQSLEGPAGKFGRLLYLPVLGNKASVFALGQVTVLTELRCDVPHTNPIGDKGRSDRAGGSNPEQIHFRAAVGFERRDLPITGRVL